MSDLQEIWNDIPQSPVSEKDIEEVVNRNSLSELERFKRLLKIETYSYFLLLIPLWFTHYLFQIELFFLFCFVSVVGALLNLGTLWRLKRLELFHDSRDFLVNCIKVLKSFVIGFMITVLVVSLIVAVFMKSWTAEMITWSEWLPSSDGLFLIMLLSFINISLLGYAWIFYISRIRSFTELLRQMDEASENEE